MKKLLWHSFFIVLLTIGITLMVNVIMNMWIFQIAFPEQSALKDFEFEDFAFSTRETNEQRDDQIVLVNIGQLRRGGIAEQINILNKYHPKVIGVGVLFNCEGLRDTINCPQLLDTLSNTDLHEAIKKSGNVVMMSRLLQSKEAFEEDQVVDSLELSDSMFSDFSKNGFGNLISSDADDMSTRSIRSFAPVWDLNGKEVFAFSVEISRLVDPSKTSRFLERDNEEEIINYKGNVSVKGSEYKSGVEYFKTLEYEDIFRRNFDTTLIKDKIIMLGYFGDYLLDNRTDEMFYSPLNRVAIGRSLPDMYGMVVHANIISMILREDYINRISPVNASLLSLIIVFLNSMLFVWLYQRNTVWYDALTLLIPALQIVTLAYLRNFLFLHFNYVLDLSAATVLLVSVSLSAGLYFGPIHRMVTRFRS